MHDRITRILKNPYIILAKLIMGRCHFISDKVYLDVLFRATFSRRIDWDNPTTFNEKLQWMKVYYRKPSMTQMVDKCAVKAIVKDLIGEMHVIPTIGLWDAFDDIDFDELPSQFVLKCTHDSGGLIIVKDKDKLNRKEARAIINKSMNRNYYWVGREWPYKEVKPRIIAEQLMINSHDSNGYDGELRDYKFFCFSGEPQYLFIASDRNTPGREVKFDYFDMEFNRLPVAQSVHPNSEYAIEKPKSFDTMVSIARKLSAGFPQVRIDLYEIDGEVYFGEYTFFHCGGFDPFIPEEYDYIWGDKIKLPFE